MLRNDTAKEDKESVEHVDDDGAEAATEAASVEEGVDAGSSCHGDQQQQQSCAICLVEFEKGDEISWSDCEDCAHHYHKTCILKWLLRHNECPSCRRPYLKLVGGENGSEVEAPEANRAVAGRNHQRPQIAGPLYSDAVLFAASVARVQASE